MIEEQRIWTFLYRAGSDSVPYWGGPPDWLTQAQFDLLVDYLVRIGQGTDYIAIGDAFAVLAGLRGSPSTPERMHVYIHTLMRSMGLEMPLRARHAAMSAASAVRAEIALLGREDESFRELFSQTLTSAMLARDPTAQQLNSMPLDDKSFQEHDLYTLHRNLSYLRLLCTLAQEPAWHRDLDRDGHFKSCLAIADTQPSWKHSFNLYGLHIGHVFAVVDAHDAAYEDQFLSAIQVYPSWQLILSGWVYMFNFSFFTEITDEGWLELFSRGYIEALSPIVAYATRHWKEWDDRPETDRLIQLVTQMCGKLNEEERRREHSQGGDSFDNQGIPDLRKEIRSQLWTVGFT
jgi:hypothetical protein